MAVTAAIVSISTTPIALTAVDATPDIVTGQLVTVKNTTAAASIFLGGSTVSTATGYPLAAGEVVKVELEEDEVLYAIAVAAGTAAVLRSRI